MSLLIAILVIHGLSMSPGWYMAACFLWALKSASLIAKHVND